MSDKQITALLKTNELLLDELISIRAEMETMRELVIDVADATHVPLRESQPAAIWSDELCKRMRLAHQKRLEAARDALRAQ